MFYTYVLESEIEPSRHYIGHTTDLSQRLLPTVRQAPLEAVQTRMRCVV